MRSRNSETGEVTIRGFTLTPDDIQFVLDCQAMARFVRGPASASHASTITKLDEPEEGTP